GEGPLAPEGRHPRVRQRGGPPAPATGGPGPRVLAAGGRPVLPRLGQRATQPHQRVAAGDGGTQRRRAPGRAGRVLAPPGERTPRPGPATASRRRTRPLASALAPRAGRGR